MKKVTLPQVMAFKDKPLTVVTCYDASFARLCEKAEIPCLLVGDSLGMVIKGEENTLSVSINELAYHVAAVRRGAPNPFLIADMPFGSYQISVEQGVESAIQLIKAGAEMVKVEGGRETLPLINKLTSIGIPVCGHVGLTPQYINTFGSYAPRGKTKGEREYIFEAAELIEDAGAQLIVLEGIPQELGRDITAALKIPTIGIGAGPDTDGQVLVIYDLLGMNDSFNPKFLKKYLNLDALITGALVKYRDEVTEKEFPASKKL